MFDWIAFLNQRRIPYVTEGPNVPRGDIGINCPFCGVSDPSEHMVISPEGRGWHCWREHSHKGKHPARLVQAVLKCSLSEAMQLTGSTSGPISANFGELVAEALQGPSTQPSTLPPPELPDNFKRFEGRWSSRPYVRYLRSRGMHVSKGGDYTRLYDMRYSTSGPFKGRIIFPVIHENKLVSWTGRTIYKNEAWRYKALTTRPDVAEHLGVKPASSPLNHYLLWFDRLFNCRADILVICEGPLDALKVNILGRPRVRATCFFTSMPTNEQVSLLRVLIPRFRQRAVLLLDDDAINKTFKLFYDLKRVGVRYALLPKGVEDPARLSSKPQLDNILSYIHPF